MFFVNDIIVIFPTCRPLAVRTGARTAPPLPAELFNAVWGRKRAAPPDTPRKSGSGRITHAMNQVAEHYTILHYMLLNTRRKATIGVRVPSPN